MGVVAREERVVEEAESNCSVGWLLPFNHFFLFAVNGYLDRAGEIKGDDASTMLNSLVKGVPEFMKYPPEIQIVFQEQCIELTHSIEYICPSFFI